MKGSHFVLILGFVILILILTNREVMWVLGIPHGEDLYRVRGIVTKAQAEMKNVRETFIAVESNREASDDSKGKQPNATREFVFGPSDQVWRNVHPSLDRTEDWPKDLFSKSGSPYNVTVFEDSIFVLSVGPDGDEDVSKKVFQNVLEGNSILEKVRYDLTYSPTNGTWASGDLLIEGALEASQAPSNET